MASTSGRRPYASVSYSLALRQHPLALASSRRKTSTSSVQRALIATLRISCCGGVVTSFQNSKLGAYSVRIIASTDWHECNGATHPGA
eukprot:scaffold364815_cov17-Prasinocladus_malaysianus.AAC.1